jgi:AGCS family alanine or glycine:cation symporter
LRPTTCKKERVTETLLAVNKTVNDFVWGPYMLVALIGVGVFFTVVLRSMQVARFGMVWRGTMGKAFRQGGGGAEGDISPMQAMTVAMGGTVGVGNIAGVATAIALGGPGAVFWDVADTLNGLMAIPNLIAIVALSGTVLALTRGLLAGSSYEAPSE